MWESVSDVTNGQVSQAVKGYVTPYRLCIQFCLLFCSNVVGGSEASRLSPGSPTL